MRDRIARTLAWVLSVLASHRPGRHTAKHLSTHPAPAGPVSVNPWSRPWTSPTKDEAQALFRRQAETTLELHVIRERRRAAVLATMGVDYPYTYEGAPFPVSVFATEGSAA
ncbi:hypothetical protein [Streptomyces sp. x-80]|uniref:hypothetical protein n=1 Tax=Streptomyces sp. x-80 TaxID=2789282 RepID=UPI00398078C3